MSGADHNLLVAALALQLEFVSRDALAVTLATWSADRTRPLGEMLVESGLLGRDRCDLLLRLVSEQLLTMPDDARRLLASLPAIQTVRESLAGCKDPEVGALLSTIGAPATVPPQSGDASYESEVEASRRFRVVRLHARGGLGQVMVAHDDELQREVALKEIQPQHADDTDSRGRFVLEGEITGRLEHPGVVPVYSLGRFADGRPFYAMRFIHGESLEESIARFHAADHKPNERALALRALLRRFVDVCNTIAYAHARGVLHRDIKPANIMLGPYGETLVVDWGLARTVDRPDCVPRPQAGTLYPMLGNDSNRTRAGSILGTPPYMSPEQADGKLDEMGPASDVYSLGATLYQIVAGKPPLEGDVREVLARARNGDFPPPRKVQPKVPAQLEAVVLRAMAHRPADRYPTPAELSAEVERWLADLPVLAYREPALERAGRWARRHRTGVAVAAALVLTTTAALAVGLVLLGGKQHETDRQRRKAVAARQEAVEKAAEAAEQRSLALATLRDVVEDRRLAGRRDEEPDEPAKTEEARLKLLRDAIGRLEKLRGTPGADEALLRACLNLGEIHLSADQFDEARAAFDRARQVAGPLLAAKPDDVGLRRDLWQALAKLGESSLGKNRPREALPWLAQALQTAQPLTEVAAVRLDGLRAVHATLLLQGRAYQSADELKESAESYRRAAATAGRLVQYNAAGGRREYALALLRLGEVRLRQGETGEALERLLDARNEFPKLPESERTSPRLMSEMAKAGDLLAEAYRKRGEKELADKEAKRARAMYETLGQENRDNLQLQSDLAGRHESQAREHERLLEYEEAAALYGKAADALGGLQQRGKLSGKKGLGDRLKVLRQKQAECALIVRALADLDWLKEQERAVAVHLFLARTRVLARQGKHDQAAQTAAALEETFPGLAEVNYRTACCHVICAEGVRAGRKLEVLMPAQRQRYDEQVRLALAQLEKARRGKYFTEQKRVLALSTEPDLKELAGNDEFKRFRARLLDEMKGP